MFNDTTGVPDKEKIEKTISAGIIYPSFTFLSIGFVCFLIFCFARPRFRDIYSPRRGLNRCKPPRIQNGFLTWIPVVFNTPESFLISTVGLDGVMFLRFFKMGIQQFFLLSIIGLTFLAPINYYGQPDRADQSNFDDLSVKYSEEASSGGLFGFLNNFNEVEFLTKLTLENVPASLLRVHIFYLWTVSFIAYTFLIVYYRDYVYLKFQYQEHVLRKSRLSKIDMRTVMVYGIPTELRHEADLAKFYEGLGLGRVESVVICRKWSRLREAVEKRSFYLRHLERCYSKVLKLAANKRVQSSVFLFHRRRTSSQERDGSSGFDIYDRNHSNSSNEVFGYSDFSESCCVNEITSRLDSVDPKYRPKHRTGFLGIFGPLVDSTDYYARHFLTYDRMVDQLRKNPEISKATSVGFVTFESPESATIAAQVNVASHPFALMTRSAPEPRDIYWQNLSSKTAESYIKFLRSILVSSILFFLIFFNTAVTSSISLLFQIDVILKWIPPLRPAFDGLSEGVKQFIQSVIPVSAISIWTSTLPSILLILSEMQGFEARSWIEMSLLSKYFFFLFWNIFFVVVTSTTAIKGKFSDVESPDKIIKLLGNSLPRSSTYFVNYAMLQAFASFPAQLLLLGPLFLTWVYRIIPWIKGTTTPREISEAYYPSILTTINYGISYPIPILIWVIGMLYAPIAPYMLLYVHIPQYETGGMHFPMAVKRCLGGMIIMQLTFMGVLSIKADSLEYISFILSVLPLLLITITMFWWFKNGYEKQIQHLPLDILGKVGRDLETQVKTTDSNGVSCKNEWSKTDDKELGIVAPEVNLIHPGDEDHNNIKKLGELKRKLSSRTLDRTQTYRSAVKRKSEQDLKSNENFGSLQSNAKENNLFGDDALYSSSSVPQTNPNTFNTTSVNNRFRSSTENSSISMFDEPNPWEASNEKQNIPSEEQPLLSNNNRYIYDHNNIYSERISEENVEDGDYFNNSMNNRSVRRGLLSSFEENEETNGNIVSMHLEPPMQRCPGILDPPLESSIPVIPDMDEEDFMNAISGEGQQYPSSEGYSTIARKINQNEIDLILYTYLHPALIGRLPISWLATDNDNFGLKTKEQPTSLMEAREEQKFRQSELRRRVIAKQKFYCQQHNFNDDGERSGNDIDIDDDVELQPRERNVSFKNRITSVIDALSSWAHLQMS
ncbi:hypothetical protein HDU92_008269 [Lobulomyces angularis]|nr:hypothetical protein HDU92_008269 [Lobulomyces angularis]